MADPAGLVSLVIPVFNERESLPVLLGEIAEAFAGIGRPREVIFVDDGSTDDSWQVVTKLAATDPTARGIRFRRNFGKAAALAAGFTDANGEVVFTLDADLQDDPHEIPKFLAKLAEGFDVVSGWKQVRHDPWHKVFPSRVFNRMVSTVTGVTLHDHNCGFKAYRAEVVKSVRLYGELHRFVPVLAAAEGFRVGELPVNHRARKFGRSKFGARRFVKGFLDMLAVRLTTAFGWRPLHLLGTVGIVLGLIAVALAVIAVGVWFLSPLAAAVLFALAVLSAVFAGQSVFTGFAAELLVARTSGTDVPYRVSARTPGG